jgi:hypothetical protein
VLNHVYLKLLCDRSDGGWLRLSALVEALDLFYDTHLSDDKPRYNTSAVSTTSAASYAGNKGAPGRPPLPKFGFKKPNYGQSNHVTATSNNSNGTLLYLRIG